jgi:hypothetical protein
MKASEAPKIMLARDRIPAIITLPTHRRFGKHGMHRAIIFILLAFSAAVAQSEVSPNRMAPRGVRPAEPAAGGCNLMISSLPAFGGIKHGMPSDEVAAAFPAIVSSYWEKLNEDGKGTLAMALPHMSDAALAEGITGVTVEFVDRKVSMILIVYRSDRWAGVSDAIRELSGLLGTDPASWTIQNKGAMLRCTDFIMNASSEPQSPVGNGLTVSPYVPPEKRTPKPSQAADQDQP